MNTEPEVGLTLDADLDVAAQLRDTMAQVCTPVAVVTTVEAAEPFGSTVSAFTSLSMSPPMMLVALARTSETLAAVRSSGCFGLNVLAADQQDLAVRFARKSPHKFRGVAWQVERGAPRLRGASGWVACEVSSLLDGGDHIIVNGLVLAADAGTGAPPLTYHQRKFGTHADVDV